MRFIVAIVAAVFSGTLSAQDLPPAPSNAEASIDRGLAFLTKDALAWRDEPK
ncbi:MAG TPA: hypothetical protein VIM11_20995 [Tepidisphaeraceae bacterium]|jgi:hypothetical protein